MTNTTDTYWSIDGVSLQTYAQNIETLGGRDAPPKYRGDDVTIPFSPGQKWMPKLPDSRVIPLAMWVRGANVDGSTPANRSNAYDDNWRALRNLMFQPGRQFVLQKRFKVGGVLRSASALAEFNDGLQPTMIGRTGSKFTVDIKLADPYFYDDVPVNTTLAAGNNNVTIPGDVATSAILITFNGARTNPVVKNNTTGVQVEYHGALLTGDLAVLDIKNFTSTTSPASQPNYNSEAMIRHSGAPQWLISQSGLNVINLAADFGTGTVNMNTRGAWL